MSEKSGGRREIRTFHIYQINAAIIVSRLSLILLLFAILTGSYGVSSTAHGQKLVIEDGFTDGNLDKRPAWFGNKNEFQIIQRKGNYLLQQHPLHYDGISYLVTDLANTTGKWIIYMQFDFSPSAYNKADIFLASDTTNLFGNPTGYAIQFGEQGTDDRFNLVYYQQGNIQDTLLKGTRDISKGGHYTLEIIHTEQGYWKMRTGSGYGKNMTPVPDSVHHQTRRHLPFFGLRTRYSETRSDRFFFDFKLDLPPVSIASYDLQQGQNLQLRFNRSIRNKKELSTSSFLITPKKTVTHIHWRDPRTVQLEFQDSLSSGRYHLTIQDLMPHFHAGQTVKLEKDFFLYDSIGKNKVIINELMPDPPADSPEYVELYNKSENYFNLSGWRIGDRHRSYLIATDTVITLKPHSFLVLTADRKEMNDIFRSEDFLQPTNWASLNNGGDQVRLIDALQNVVDTVTYSSEQMKADKSLERKSSNAPSYLIDNWGITLNHRGSPGQPNTLETETNPPRLEIISSDSQKSLTLRFSEPVATNLGSDNIVIRQPHQTFSHLWRFSSALPAFESEISLIMEEPFKHGNRYHIRLDSIADAFGNLTRRIDTSFSYYQTIQPDSGDILISEFIYDPPAGQPEYIELYNNSDYSIPISDLQLSDKNHDAKPLTSTPRMLSPSSYLVITSDEMQTETSYPILHTKNFPSLNNGGDAIVLYGPDFALLDSLFYIPVWGGTGKSLERRSYHASATYMSNWQTYSGDGLGTPGKPNQASPDTVGPLLRKSEVYHERGIRFYFNEMLFKGDTPISNYITATSLEIRKSVVYDSTLFIWLKNALPSPSKTPVTLSGIKDPFGNSLRDTTITLHYISTEKPDQGEVVINEFRPGSDRQPAFVEIFNRSNKNIKIGQWTLSDRTETSVIEVPNEETSILEPFQYLTLSEKPIFPSRPGISITPFPDLSESGDIITLRDRRQTLIDSIAYSDRWNLPSDGRSMERKDPAAPSSDPSNWTIHPEENTHTAGLQNASFQPDTTAPSLLFAYVQDSAHILLEFDEFVFPSENTIFKLNDTILTWSVFNDTSPHRLQLTGSISLFPPRSQDIYIRHLPDGKENKKPIKSELAFSPRTGDLLFTEVLFDPLKDAYDGKPDQGEYVEIYNNRPYPLRLDEISLRKRMDEKGNKDLISFTKTTPWIPSHAYGIIHADTAEQFQDSRLNRYFELPADIVHLQIDAQTLRLHKERDSLFIVNSSHNDLARLYYETDWHTHLAETKGIALEKISPGNSSTGSTFWSSSTHRSGGTPGQKNSIHMTTSEHRSPNPLNLFPNPFSPDGDGLEEHLAVKWKFAQSDNLLDISIYDRYGRLIRILTEDRLAGFTGELMWNGLNDNRQQCKIGPYIIFVEVYNPRTGTQKHYKKTAILARRL